MTVALLSMATQPFVEAMQRVAQAVEWTLSFPLPSVVMLRLFEPRNPVQVSQEEQEEVASLEEMQDEAVQWWWWLLLLRGS